MSFRRQEIHHVFFFVVFFLRWSLMPSSVSLLLWPFVHTVSNRADTLSGTGGHPTIPPALSVKANARHDQLTPEERALLLSRGDPVGKALAQPDALTAAEAHEIVGMPPPDLVRAKIQRATGGKLSTVDELYAKAKMHPPTEGQYGAGLSNDEAELLAFDFHTSEEYRALRGGKWSAGYAPGVELAITLVVLRLGWYLQADPVIWPPAVALR